MSEALARATAYRLHTQLANMHVCRHINKSQFFRRLEELPSPPAGGDPEQVPLELNASEAGGNLEPMALPQGWVLGASGTAGREFIVDSGASFHLVSRGSLSPEELSAIRFREVPQTIQTANGPVEIYEETDVHKVHSQ